MAVHDEELLRASDYTDALFNKVLTLSKEGMSVQLLGGNEGVVRTVWKAAETQAEHVVALAPKQVQAEQLLAFIRKQLRGFEAESSEEV